MDPVPTREELCHELVGELTDMAGWLASADVKAKDFVQMVAVFEAKKLQRFGFKLSWSISHERLVHFTLRLADNGELCASMDVDPSTGQLSVQHACYFSSMKTPTPSSAWHSARDRSEPPPPDSLFVIGVEGPGGEWNGCHVILAETCDDGSIHEVTSGMPIGFTWTEIDWWMPLEMGLENQAQKPCSD